MRVRSARLGPEIGKVLKNTHKPRIPVRVFIDTANGRILFENYTKPIIISRLQTSQYQRITPDHHHSTAHLCNETQTVLT